MLSRGELSSFLTTNIAGATAVLMGVMVAGGVSGGHLNPAVSLAQFVRRKINFVQLVLYQLAQYLGAFIGALLVYVTYYGLMFQ